jgi:WD40 repeat protein/tRNA A-37 threonylcarbamoyl transferase component Bud32
MSTCPQCGGIVSGREALCPECIKRATLQEAPELSGAETALAASELLPETSQARPRGLGSGASIIGTAGGELWGDYQLLETIGRGAMGTVFKARHVHLNRLVALKLIREGRNAAASELKRFQREAEAVARLQHPNIVTLYETGEVQGQPFLAMEYIAGQTLAERIATNPLAPRQAAECMKRIAEAVQYAHEQGVLHRDLKPSNVVVDSNLEPRVMDFGLARLVEQESEMTLTGMALGSPSYMAPEQAAGRTREISATSDVYALGAILYEALTGRPPFQADTSVETMRQVIENEPVPPRLLNARVPQDLSTITLKCLEKAQAHRYPTAKALAAELARYLDGEPILARPISAGARAWRWCRRKPALAVSLGAAVGLLLVVAIGSPIAFFRIDNERQRVEAARVREAASRQQAELAERQTRQQLYAALLEQAHATVRSGELGQRVQALEAVRRAGEITNSAELRGAALAALALPDLRREAELALGTNVTFAQCDGAFARVAVGHGPGPVEIREVADQRLLASLPASTNLAAYWARWSADGRFLAVKRDHDGEGARAIVEVWEVAKARCVLSREISWMAAAFHPRVNQLWLAQNRRATWWDLENSQELARFDLPSEPLRLEISPDAQRVAVLQNEAVGQLFTINNATNGQVLLEQTFKDYIHAAQWHPAGESVALADRRGRVQLVDARTGAVRLLGRHKGAAVSLAFSPEGAYLVSGGWEEELICWDMRTFSRAFIIGLGSYRLQFSADGRQCATVRGSVAQPGCLEGFTLHSFERPAGYRELTGELGAGLPLAVFSPDGRWLAASGPERLGVWDMTSEGPAALAPAGAEARPFFGPDGAEVFGSSRDDECSRWHLSPGADPAAAPILLQIELRQPEGFTSLCLVSNLVVWTGSFGSGAVPLDRLASHKPAWSPTVAGINNASPDGRWLGVFRPYTPVLYVYRLPELEPVAALTNHANIRTFQFSPRSDEIMVCSRGRVEFWSTNHWERKRELPAFFDSLYTTDSRVCWLSTDYRTSGLYDIRTLEPLLLLHNGVRPLALSPDGHYLAVSVDLDRLQVWDLKELRQHLRESGVDWEDRLETVEARQSVSLDHGLK